jgi:hypothetical protein
VGAIGKYGKADPRLHHPDGSHRTTARTSNGAEVDRFERAIKRHLEQHEEKDD